MTRPRSNAKPAPMLDRAAVEKLFASPLPHSLEAEMALLGSIILAPRMLDETAGIVPSGDWFYSEAHAAVYDALLALGQKHQQGDLVQLADMLKGDGALDLVGGPDFLVRLAEQVPSSANAAHYARIVRDKGLLRRLIDASGQTIYDAFHGADAQDGVRGVLGSAEARLFALTSASGDGEVGKPEGLGALLQAAIDASDPAETGPPRGVLTGFDAFDNLTGGLQPGEMNVIAARPSMGKTAFALCLALNIASGVTNHEQSQPPRPVVFVSLEMSREAVGERMLCMTASLDVARLRRKTLTSADYERAIFAAGALAKAPLYILAPVEITAQALRSQVRRMASAFKPALIVVDYLQMVRDPFAAKESAEREVASASRTMKFIARETRLPVVVLSQMNREVENRHDNRPRMSDLRGSGTVEQDADLIAFLHRPAYFHRGDRAWEENHPAEVERADLIVAKNRNGETGDCPLRWSDGKYTSGDWAPPGESSTRARWAPPVSPPKKQKPAPPQAHSPLPPERDEPDPNELQVELSEAREGQGDIPF